MSRISVLDTNHASEIIRNRVSPILERIRKTTDGLIAISAITKAELIHGVKRRPDAKKLAQAVGVFLQKVHIFPWTDNTAEVYGALRASLEATGISLGSMDLMIAAHAVELDAVLLTSDKAFSRVSNLRVESWSS